jgi:hypothetical protein
MENRGGDVMEALPFSACFRLRLYTNDTYYIVNNINCKVGQKPLLSRGNYSKKSIN